MENEPTTSEVDNTAKPLLTRWTNNLQFLSEFTFELLKKALRILKKYLRRSLQTQEIGIWIVQGKYVKNVGVKANELKDQFCRFLIKANVNAAVKKIFILYMFT